MLATVIVLVLIGGGSVYLWNIKKLKADLRNKYRIRTGRLFGRARPVARNRLVVCCCHDWCIRYSRRRFGFHIGEIAEEGEA